MGRVAITVHGRIILGLVSLVPLLNLDCLTSSLLGASTRASETVIFEVSSIFFPSDQTKPHLSIQPIVIIEGGQYRKPPEHDEDTSRFGKRYFRLGATYRLLFGGGEAGTVRVTQWAAPSANECFQNAARVQMKSAQKIGRNGSGLATNSLNLGRRNSARRLPTSAEQLTMLRLAQEAFLTAGVIVKGIESLHPFGLAVSDLDGDGRNEMIGSFSIKEDPDRDLFLIGEIGKEGYRSALVWHHSGSGPDAQVRSLLDHLDLDGDGMDEIITLDEYSGATGYQIYKKRGGQWQVVYEGGGISC